MVPNSKYYFHFRIIHANSWFIIKVKILMKSSNFVETIFLFITQRFIHYYLSTNILIKWWRSLVLSFRMIADVTDGWLWNSKKSPPAHFKLSWKFWINCEELCSSRREITYEKNHCSPFGMLKCNPLFRS